MADLERLADLSPTLGAIYELAQAHLELLRDRPERALPIYERVLATEAARALPSYPVERAMHAQALCALDDHEAARALCLTLMDEIATSQRDSDHIVLAPRQRLARAEAGLGNLERATELLESCFERARRYGNPLAIGTVHRELAHVAMLAGDRESFDLHLAAMTEQFSATENPCLIQQCDALRTQAVRAEMRGGSSPDRRQVDDLDGATVIKTAVEGLHASSSEPPTKSDTPAGTARS